MTGQSFTTTGIILTRTNFGEADRIISFITKDKGKLTAIAKGVRKTKSKLAGGLELLSISHLTILKGKGEVDTIMSTRLLQHFGNIVKDLERTEATYEFIKQIDKNTEQSAEGDYFNLLKAAMRGLDEQLEPKLVKLWFGIQLLNLTGHAPNLHSDVKGQKLTDSASYDFHPDGMHFVPQQSKRGRYGVRDIKFLRVALEAGQPDVLARVQNSQVIVGPTLALVNSMRQNYLRQ